MNAKIDRIAREIEKSRAKITDEQARLKELERQRTDLENTEIVTLFRSADIAPGELAAILRAYKENGATPAQAAPAHDYPRSGGYSRPDAVRQEDDDTDE